MRKVHKYNHLRIKDPITGKWKHPTEPHRVRGLPLHLYIESRTRVNVSSGCWEWIDRGKGPKSVARHTALKKGTHSVGVASWECFFGSIPKGLNVCHTCDNGHCANPMHLFLGSQKDNMQDCVFKGRHYHGARHFKAKLNEEIISKMKNLRSEGKTYEQIANAANIGLSVCWSVLNGKAWKHLSA